MRVRSGTVGDGLRLGFGREDARQLVEESLHVRRQRRRQLVEGAVHVVAEGRAREGFDSERLK